MKKDIHPDTVKCKAHGHNYWLTLPQRFNPNTQNETVELGR